MKRNVIGTTGRYAVFVIIALVGTAAILFVLRASVLTQQALENARHSDDVNYQLQLLKEKQR